MAAPADVLSGGQNPFMTRSLSISSEHIASRILVIRGLRVMIDADLAELYGVATKRLNEQVRRNSDRFADFFFQLTAAERSRVVANCDHLAKLKFSPTLPYAFTEHGALMGASVLNTARAIEVGRTWCRHLCSNASCLPRTRI